jgi:hypothetical protein
MVVVLRPEFRPFFCLQQSDFDGFVSASSAVGHRRKLQQ